MNAVELALEKQRLRLAAASQRIDLSRHAAGLMPLFDAADRVHAGARWAARHPEIVGGGVALLAAARPGVRRFFWRWGKRAFIVWRLWRESEHWLASPSITPSGSLNSR
ncbi:MAG: YqjK-like family protein [Rhodocyclaceae bacterium]|nr:YqjK-like family protein [Rhodocyclaceae bacterium]